MSGTGVFPQEWFDDQIERALDGGASDGYRG